MTKHSCTDWIMAAWNASLWLLSMYLSDLWKGRLEFVPLWSQGPSHSVWLWREVYWVSSKQHEDTWGQTLEQQGRGFRWYHSDPTTKNPPDPQARYAIATKQTVIFHYIYQCNPNACFSLHSLVKNTFLFFFCFFNIWHVIIFYLFKCIFLQHVITCFKCQCLLMNCLWTRKSRKSHDVLNLNCNC